MVTQRNGRLYCDKEIGGHPCNGLMRFRRKTKDYACTICPATIPLDQLTPTESRSGDTNV